MQQQKKICTTLIVESLQINVSTIDFKYRFKEEYTEEGCVELNSDRTFCVEVLSLFW